MMQSGWEEQDLAARRLQRWRLVLGGSAEQQTPLAGDALQIDRALGALYDQGGRRGGLGASAPNVARWLGDIRKYFPQQVVRVLQQDALQRLNLQSMLLEPELLQSLTPDVHLAANLAALGHIMPEQVKQTARLVVRRVLDDLERRLSLPMQQAVRGALSRHSRKRRPRSSEIDWARTIRANLRHYLPQQKQLILQTLHGFGRRQSSLRDVVLCIDQSGSMATSVVYASVFGAVLASLRAVQTRMVLFDTQVVDLSDKLQDPVDVLFGVQLGGGTDINRALAYCQTLITRPQETVLILISDLEEGGDARQMLARSAQLQAAGVQMIALLALNDEGSPAYSQQMAQDYAALGIPAFACTPDLFPGLMAAALQREDIGLWAARNELQTAAPVAMQGA
ncbi:VWA domain-containing protein [Massilia sp. W12]|uniref:VWA domain-containing protein n=1 Tax=Massilia sp. W12 TaxID=3126507 RepID=UPI0030D490FC